MPRSIDSPSDSSSAKQRERATQRLVAIGEMTGGIAHDFRSLLAVIDSGLRLVERNSTDPEKMRRYIKETREGIIRGKELTSQLLNFANHQALDVHAGDVNEFLRGFEPLLRYGAGSDIRVKLVFGHDVPSCLVDPAFFDAAILNLVVNARDASPNGGEVRIVTDRWQSDVVTYGTLPPGAYARVCVEDDGAGMPDHVLRAVFDPFFTTKGETGTGIGLAQVQTFARMVGGHVDIVSEMGIGTKVTLLFPSMQSES